MKNIAFDNDKYLEMQSKHILERISKFDNKLYLEFGGKLFDDHHASRVLPGFQPDSKLKMLLQLKDEVEIVIAICAKDIESKKVRSDLGITYDQEVLRLIDAFRSVGLFVGSVTVTQYTNQPAADAFIKHINSLGVKTFVFPPVLGYPNNVSLIVSDEGYGKCEYIETEKPLVVVTAPGPGSGKMCVCLSQLYNEHERGVKAGYAKYETFPIWNLPLKHPVNLAYEAATAEMNDINMIDPFHLKAYGETTVNYNRDIEIFPVLNTMFQMIFGESPYKSPTDMGVNMAGNCICNDDAAIKASNDEIIRRYYKLLCNYAKGSETKETIDKIESIMAQANLTQADRKVAVKAGAIETETGLPGVAIELKDGTLITGKTSELLGSASAALLNSLKYLANIDDSIHLLSPAIIEPIQKLKTTSFGHSNPRLHTDEVLLALSICAASDENAAKALNQLEKLAKCEVHSTVILSEADVETFRHLKTNLTCSPTYQSNKLYHK